MIPHAILATVWAAILAATFVFFLALDGFDLGIGLLVLLTRKPEERATMIAAIGPVWHANETWLVLAGAILFGAFPGVYSVVLNAFYIPILIMLFGFMFRAAAFAFRGHSERKTLWAFVFGAGSVTALMGLAFILGGLLSGIRTAEGAFAGSPWDWLTPVSVLMTAALTLGFTILGALYLHAKTDGALRSRMRWVAGRCAMSLAVVVLGSALAVSLFREAVGLSGWVELASWPAAIETAAAPSGVLLGMLGGIGLLIPVMFVYTLYLYRVFRGRTGVARETGDEAY